MRWVRCSRATPQCACEQLFVLGLAITAGFALLRASNLYGDPAPWTIQDNRRCTVLSFINCEKYPPSLLYLAMTLGPALMLAGGRSKRCGASGGLDHDFRPRAAVLLRRAYFSDHLLAGAFAWATTGDSAWLFGLSGQHKPAATAWPARHLRGVARRRRRALSAVPLVCRPQATWQRMVVELSLGLRAFTRTLPFCASQCRRR